VACKRLPIRNFLTAFMSDITINLDPGRKVYFASDFHLGIGTESPQQNRQREQKIVRWLDMVRKDCSDLFLMGDLFDFWFEYRQTVPRGHVRFLGKLAGLSDAGIALHIFPGNHDMWMFDYLSQEIGATIHKDPVRAAIGNKTFLLGHGDGLGPGDHMYKVLKFFFRNPVAQFCFRWLHPDIGVYLARTWSKSSRISKEGMGHDFKGDQEYLVRYCAGIESSAHFDYYVFGHRHLALNVPIGPRSQYFNLGTWFNVCSYAVFDGSTMQLQQFESQ
jgi:UDP-2,3-diacylglucosamine hydrolase